MQNTESRLNWCCDFMRWTESIYGVWYYRLLFFFFFKQKTAYELRISDWSSDVCSSYLHGARHFRFTLDLLDIKILGVLVGPVIGVHRLAERFRGRLPVAVMVAIAMRARLALPGDGIELLGHPLAFPHLLALLRFLTGAIGG